MTHTLSQLSSHRPHHTNQSHIPQQDEPVWPNSISVMGWDAGKKLHIRGARCRKTWDADFGIRNYGYCIMLTISGDDSILNNFLSGSTDLVNIQKEKSVVPVFPFFIKIIKRYAFVVWSVA